MALFYSKVSRKKKAVFIMRLVQLRNAQSVTKVDCGTRELGAV